ncbi:MAG: hypothetical protein LBM73_01230 [Candidatus Nomurabacteria bacterium]|jgi:geranylgeranyl pyrophosphate synthase|nr:hypothetical protein [Candidatus Nomurabacteria bacterium]
MRSDFWKSEKSEIDSYISRVSKSFSDVMRPIVDGDAEVVRAFPQLLNRDSSRIRGFLALLTTRAGGGLMRSVWRGLSLSRLFKLPY